MRRFSLALLIAAAALGCGGPPEPPPRRDTGVQNVVLIGWDGCHPVDLEVLLKKGRLPNLQALIGRGGYVRTRVTTGATVTKPGWAEILTGYSAIRLGTVSNKVYAPIPKGFTVFERLKDLTSGRMASIFLTGKINNLAARGPHSICENCATRDPATAAKIPYWDESAPGIQSAPTEDRRPQRWVSRRGEPYLYTAQSVDLYKSGLGPADAVGSAALEALERFHARPFIAFFHFEEPDEQGHDFGENSAQYRAAPILTDRWLGRIVAELRKLGIEETTAVIVTTDHGFDLGRKEHFHSPETWLAVSLKRKLRSGDRKDVTPTIYDALGWDGARLRPKLDGRSLFSD